MDTKAYLETIETQTEKVENWSALPAEPLVSVAMLAYNHAAFIEQAVEGVLMQQTSFPFELIVADDNSSDGTREILFEYQRKHPDKIRLRLARKNLFSQNIKPAAGLLYACRGKYLAICDGDDYWTDRQKLQIQADYLDNQPGFVACYHNVDYVDADDRNLGPYFEPDQKTVSVLEEIVFDSDIPSCSIVFKSGLFTELPDWFFLVSYGDSALNVINAHHGKYGYIDRNMGAYRRHSGGVTSGQSEKQAMQTSIEYYEKLNSALNYRHDKIIREVLSYLHFDLAIAYELSGDLAIGRRHAVKSVVIYPPIIRVCSWALAALFLRLFSPRLLRSGVIKVKHLGTD